MSRARAGVIEASEQAGPVNCRMKVLSTEASAQKADNTIGAQAEASLVKMGMGIGSVASVDVGLFGRVGAQVGAVNSLDLGIIGGEIGKNGIRLSVLGGSIRLFGKE